MKKECGIINRLVTTSPFCFASGADTSEQVIFKASVYTLKTRSRLLHHSQVSSEKGCPLPSDVIVSLHYLVGSGGKLHSLTVIFHLEGIVASPALNGFNNHDVPVDENADRHLRSCGLHNGFSVNPSSQDPRWWNPEIGAPLAASFFTDFLKGARSDYEGIELLPERLKEKERGNLLLSSQPSRFHDHTSFLTAAFNVVGQYDEPSMFVGSVMAGDTSPPQLCFESIRDYSSFLLYIKKRPFEDEGPFHVSFLLDGLYVNLKTIFLP